MQKIPSSFWLILDKPLGISSNQALGKIKRLFGIKKAGYSGTLDPLATGVLPIAFGEALKTMAHMTAHEKTYVFQVRFGEQTETDDGEGEVIKTSPHRPTRTEIEDILPAFSGSLSQIPPLYSAIKISGKRASDRIRRGESLTLPPRQIFIHSLCLLSHDDRDHATFEVRCSPGTYVRSLARDLSLALGTVGHVRILRRTAVGDFSIERAVTFEKIVESLKRLGHSECAFEYFLSIDTGLDDILAVTVDEKVGKRLLQGQRVPFSLQSEGEEAAERVRIYENGRFLGFSAFKCELSETEGKQGVLHPLRMINDEN